ncbi:MAG: GIY-YIG nuclease family protein [Gammaproteobacteria bacterium]
MDRQHILREIQRTAAENGGVPLGRQRFWRETGIKESDWLGKIWARWNDAVCEAGFSPNSLQRSFTDEALLEHYAKLVASLGRVPTAPELKLQARQGTGFPSHNTFARFGPKGELLAKLHAFALGRTKWQAVAALCEPYAAVEEARPITPSAVQTFGFVYLIKASGHYKIGRTNALGRRERELAIQLPERSKTVHAIQTDDPSGIEAYWHRRFEAKRRNGEWFELSPEDIAAFRRRKFM